MNILIINSAKSWGGNELWTSNISNQLAMRGHRIVFACRSNIFDDRLNKAIDIVKLPLKYELDFSTINKIKEIIKIRKIDVILATKRKEYFIAGRIGRQMKIPVVFRLGITRKISKWDFPQRWVYRKLPSAIIVNANIIKRELVGQSIADADKIHVIYNGYDFPEEIIDKENIFIKKEKFTFAAAGRLTAQKGYDILLEAAKIIKERGINFYLYIAGDGNEKDKLKKFAEANNLNDNVFFVGEIKETRAFFNKADAIVIPSRSEGIPNTLFEAWSVKKSVITSDASGLPEVVKNRLNGLMCRLNPNEFADAMQYLIENPEILNKFGKAGFETLKNDFTMEKMVSEVEKLLIELKDKCTKN